MERLPSELCMMIFRLVDHRGLASSLQVCRKWKILGSEDALWCNLCKERWGGESRVVDPQDGKSWKDVYIVKHRCDRYGLGSKIVREGDDYYLIHRGKIQEHLGALRCRKDNKDEKKQGTGVADSILFFIGDLEAACADAKRIRT